MIIYLIDYTHSLFPWGVIYHTVTKFFWLNSFFFFFPKNLLSSVESYHQFINNVTIETIHQPLVDPLESSHYNNQTLCGQERKALPLREALK